MRRFRFHDADDDGGELNEGRRDSLPFPRGGVHGISIPLDQPGRFEAFTDHLFKQMDDMQKMIDEVNDDLDEADRALDIIAHLPFNEPRYPAA
ncbi:MAG: hypothetical protein KDA21_11835 [Phycisphaerales bacterium]|nr:hypothetical protein [Phycisphaerales bacterium]